MYFNLYPAKEVQLFPGLGIYSGIFAIYIQCPSKESRTATIVFYALCLLYVLSTATVVSDLLFIILEVSNSSISENIFVYQLCRCVHHRFDLNLTYSQFYFAFQLFKP